MFSLVVLRKRVKDFGLADKRNAPCNTCIYALRLTNDCDACCEPIDGRCGAYKRE
jgi:hypothetical protein